MMPVLPLSLFPGLDWWATARAAGGAELFSGHLPAGHPNQYSISSANGLLLLSVPLQGGRRQRSPLADWRIDYTHDWQRRHWGALYSAYGRAPFFEHFAPGLRGLIYGGHEHLERLNHAALTWVSQSLRLSLLFSDAINEAPQPLPALVLPAYHQVFEARLGFLSGLSVLDLMMNEGPESMRYLIPA
ncbi:MAG: WbqC family protein [Bacteroidetes bacterium]|nr:WbqC family protein [Bacteroidota bacterium]